MASYVLLLHGQGKARFQLGIHYVTINLLASALFLIGLGMIYGSVGSLNMADVARLNPLPWMLMHIKLPLPVAYCYLWSLVLRPQCFLWVSGYLKPMP